MLDSLVKFTLLFHFSQRVPPILTPQSENLPSPNTLLEEDLYLSDSAPPSPNTLLEEDSCLPSPMTILREDLYLSDESSWYVYYF